MRCSNLKILCMSYTNVETNAILMVPNWVHTGGTVNCHNSHPKYANCFTNSVLLTTNLYKPSNCLIPLSNSLALAYSPLILSWTSAWLLRLLSPVPVVNTDRATSLYTLLSGLGRNVMWFEWLKLAALQVKMENRWIKLVPALIEILNKSLL